MSALDRRITMFSRTHVHSESFSLELCEAATMMMLEMALDDPMEIKKRLVLLIVWELTNKPELKSVKPEQLSAFIVAHQDELDVIFGRFDATADVVGQIALALHESGDTPAGQA